MTPSQREIVLVPVPFTDLTSQKQRPVIVISNDQYQQQCRDFVGVALTSQLLPTPFGLTISSTDLVDGQLHRPSQIRCDKIFSLAQSLVRRRFGAVSPAILEQIRLKIAILVG